ncbi:M20/M25/M40 family metallo-hydrolase [Novosphingobium sp. Fuku2-ISO-50]|uniref:M20/M25/M40 family metallo-hydrolase n=1 Tax=Novosphingobium sp. Fuku2-ISO-50 TaxID=1739114 RepID=UPI000B27884A|nr:M20/M25/M40 family metallo-hydrolase [Novosphingobium sp. Fuku2-ISO-50]
MRKTLGMISRHLPALAVLLLALALAILGTTPPRPTAPDRPAQDFSAGRAMADVRVITKAPHPAGSAADAALRGYLTQRLTGLGMTVRADSFEPDPDRIARNIDWGGPADRPRVLTNLIAVLPGRNPALPAVALMAHHDSVASSPGGADDGAGLAAILETVRAIAQGPRPARDLVVILTDGEEIGLDGARHFFGGLPPPSDPLRDHIGTLVNLEARGGGGRAMLFQTADDNGEGIALAAGAIRHPGGSSLAVFLYSVLPNDTDLTEALSWTNSHGVAAYNFAFIGRPGLYHSPKADADRLDQGALQDIGGQVLDLTRALLAAPSLPHAAPDVVFFDVFGLTMVTLPTYAGWIMLGLAFIAIGAIWHRRGRGRGHARAAIGGAGRMLGLAGLATLLVMGANLVSFHVGGPNYYDRLAATPRLEAMAGASAFAAFFIVIGRWRPGRAGLVGALVPLWLAAAVIQALAPVAAYVVIVPVLLAAVIALLPEGKMSRVLAVVIAALVIGYQFMLGHEMLQAVGGDLPLVVALPLVLAALTILPLWQPMSRRSRRVAVLAFGLAAIAIALLIRAAPIADTIPPYSQTTRPVS